MLYKCKICEKEFNKKCHYENHLNRINPCMKKPKKIQEITPNYTELTPKKQEITPKMVHKCNYCLKIYCRSNVLKKHLLICKVKKQDIEEKESILNKLLSTIDQQKEQINQLIKTNENLINQMKVCKTQNNKNIKHQNNGTINNTINIIQFGKEDLSKIDNKEFFEALTQMGYKIPAKMVENIHINDKYPEYKNIYISDINRGKAMAHDGKKWNLERYEKISDKLLGQLIEELMKKIKKLEKENTLLKEKEESRTKFNMEA